jgi:hypothetical protein
MIFVNVLVPSSAGVTTMTTRPWKLTSVRVSRGSGFLAIEEIQFHPVVRVVNIAVRVLFVLVLIPISD